MFRHHFKLMLLQLRIRAVQEQQRDVRRALAPACTEPHCLQRLGLQGAEPSKRLIPAACARLTQALAEVGGVSGVDFQSSLKCELMTWLSLTPRRRVSWQCAACCSVTRSAAITCSEMGAPAGPQSAAALPYEVDK